MHHPLAEFAIARLVERYGKWQIPSPGMRFWNFFKHRTNLARDILEGVRELDNYFVEVGRYPTFLARSVIDTRAPRLCFRGRLCLSYFKTFLRVQPNLALIIIGREVRNVILSQKLATTRKSRVTRCLECLGQIRHDQPAACRAGSTGAQPQRLNKPSHRLQRGSQFRWWTTDIWTLTN